LILAPLGNLWEDTFCKIYFNKLQKILDNIFVLIQTLVEMNYQSIGINEEVGIFSGV